MVTVGAGEPESPPHALRSKTKRKIRTFDNAEMGALMLCSL